MDYIKTKLSESAKLTGTKNHKRKKNCLSIAVELITKLIQPNTKTELALFIWFHIFTS